MKKILILLTIFTTFASTAQSVAINTDGSAANASAMLDVSSTTKGFLPPRMTQAQRNLIDNPSQGLIIYCTDCGAYGEPQFYNGLAWVNMIGGTASTQPQPLAIGSTTAATKISKTTVTSGGNITSGNGITAIGVCWSTSSSPTIANSKTTQSGSTGSFTSNITGLIAGTLYYIRAYATNASETIYGNEVTVRTTAYKIGDSALGGKIAYLLQPNDPGYDVNITHGLVVTSQGYAKWGCATTNISGANGTAYGTGNQNTINIVANSCSLSTSAPGVCNYLNTGGYSDWFLPSKDELNKIFLSIDDIGSIDKYIRYWTSSQHVTNTDWNTAWTQNLCDGKQNPTYKDSSTVGILAVRYF